MATQLDDLSIAIGRLQEGQSLIHKRMDEDRNDWKAGISSIETKLGTIVENLDTLPPSPACTNKHAEIDTRMRKLEVNHAVIVAKSSFIGGAIGAVAGFLSKYLTTGGGHAG
jgi:hypothetical protein